MTTKTKREIEDVLPVAPLQEGLLYLVDAANEQIDLYVGQLLIDLEGELDAERLKAAAEQVVRRQPALRSAIRQTSRGEHPVQVIHRDVSLPWFSTDLSPLQGDDQEASLQELLRADRGTGFDLARPPLLRFHLIKTGPTRHRVLLTTHHILLDGWSLPILLTDLVTLYNQGGSEAGMPPAPSQRAYFEWLGKQDRAAAADAWRNALAGFSEPSLLQQPHVPDSAPIELMHTVDEAGTTRVMRALGGSKLTLNTLLQGAWGLVLGRLLGRQDVVFGGTVSGRSPEVPDIESTIGLFINTLPVRVSWDDWEPAEGYFQRIQREQASLIPYHHLPLSEVARAAGFAQAGTLFDTLTVTENYPTSVMDATDPSSDGVTAVGIAGADDNHYPLSIAALPGSSLRLRISYQPSVVNADLAAVLGPALESIMRQFAADPSQPVGALGFAAGLPRLQRETLPATLRPETLPDMVARRVDENPDAVAIATPTENLTFEQLGHRVSALMTALSDRGVGQESLVAVILPRSIESVVARLAVMAAGAAYVPIDPDYPRERIHYMLQDSKPTLVIASETDRDLCAELPTLVVGADKDDGSQRATRWQPSQGIAPDNAAYVIYTSGTSGRPKGVVVPHTGIANLVTYQRDRLGVTPDSRVLQLSSPSFDASVFELCMALPLGARLVLPEEGARAGEMLADTLDDQHVTHALITPSVLATMPQAGVPSLQSLVSGGEALSQDLVSRWSVGRRMFNAYGPTECTVAATASQQPLEQDVASPSIGRPLPGVSVYVLDQSLQPSLPGATGEIWISGPSLARGYLGRPGLTAERFVACPFGGPGERMYRSGDLGRWREDGDLAYEGRADAQVKVRGFRIELEEVEAALVAVDAVSAAGVVVDEAGQRLVAYVVPAPGLDVVDGEAIRFNTTERLPEHMVPSVVMTVADLPRTPNGKIDRRALTDVWADRGREPVDQSSVAGPLRIREDVVARLFAEALDLPRVPKDVSFFDLGGHSLVATRLVSRLRSAFGVQLSVRALLESPTVAGLTMHLEDLAEVDHDDSGSLDVLLPLREKGDRSPLWCLPPGAGLSWGYAGLLGSVAGRPILGLQARGLAGQGGYPESFDAMVDDYGDIIRTRQQSGPYNLVGWSLGGIVSHALACRFQTAGETVSLLAVLDARPDVDMAAAADVSFDEQDVLRSLLDLAGLPQPGGDVNFAEVQEALVRAGNSLGGLPAAALPDFARVATNLSRKIMPTYRRAGMGVFHGDLLLVSAGADGDTASTARAWEPFVDGVVRTHVIDCSHDEIANPGPMAEIGRVLTAALRG